MKLNWDFLAGSCAAWPAIGVMNGAWGQAALAFLFMTGCAVGKA